MAGSLSRTPRGTASTRRAGAVPAAAPPAPVGDDAAPPASGFRGVDVRQLKERWEQYLQAKRLNTTAQREAIVEHFFRAPEHISIDELLARVRRRHPKVGYATVYRTLKLLVDGGLASERQFGDGQARYEVAGEHHDHLICVKCGVILEFEDAEIERLQERVAQRLGGFTVIRHHHELYALCPRERGIDDRCPGQKS